MYLRTSTALWRFNGIMRMQRRLLLRRPPPHQRWGRIASSFPTVTSTRSATFGTSRAAPSAATSTTRAIPFAEFPRTVTVYSGTSAGGCGDLPLTTMTSWDRGLGLPLMTVGPNGDTTTFEYEAFGRQDKVFAPNPSIPGMSVNVADSIVEYFDDVTGRRIHARRLRATGQYQDTWTHVDALGRTLATFEAADPAAGDAAPWVLHGLTDRSPSGAPIRNYQGEFWTGNPSTLDPGYRSTQPFERTEYDWAGRATKQYGLDGAAGAAVEHHPQYRLTRDAEQLDPTSPHAALGTRTNMDGHGRTTDTVVSVQSVTGVDTITTHVDYQATGEPSRITRQGAGGTYTRTLQYDSLGRLVQNNEPNAGTWLYAYNDSGDLVATSDPRGCGVNLSYTASGEKLAEDVSPCSAANLTTPRQISQAATAPRHSWFTEAQQVSRRLGGSRTCTIEALTRNSRMTCAADCCRSRGGMARPGAAAPTLAARYGISDSQRASGMAPMTLSRRNRRGRTSTSSSMRMARVPSWQGTPCGVCQRR